MIGRFTAILRRYRDPWPLRVTRVGSASRARLIAPIGALPAVLAILLTITVHAQPGDVLPSWNDGLAKKAIVEFVGRTTTEGSADYLRQQDRIAVFDNDGTLWTEQPTYVQATFARDRIKAMAAQHPEWQFRQPFKAALAGDKTLAVPSEKDIAQILAATHAGMTVEEFHSAVLEWLATARHPRFNRPFTDLVYQPMLELLAFLRTSGFKTFIVSGGGVDFIRPWSEKAYGIPPEQIIGSSGVVRFEADADGKLVLRKIAKIAFVDDGPGKPVGINQFIGRRPILAFGNSDGDLQMLQWAAAGGGSYFAGIVHHTDAEREYAYDRQSQVGKLDKALDEARKHGWLVVDMKQDWKVIYPFEISK